MKTTKKLCTGKNAALLLGVLTLLLSCTWLVVYSRSTVKAYKTLPGRP
jgi:hypothetical protein